MFFTAHEILSLQSLVGEYKHVVIDYHYGYDVGDVKSSYLKELLITEYNDSIGFKQRNVKNKSVLLVEDLNTWMMPCHLWVLMMKRSYRTLLQDC